MPERTPTVLLVEDDHAVANALMRRLNHEGFRVLPAPDGDSAVHAGAQQRPDLLLVDVHLPIRDGFEVAQALRARYGTLPIVFMTADTSPSTRTAAERFEPCRFIAKPFTTAYLMHRLREAAALIDGPGPVAETV